MLDWGIIFKASFRKPNIWKSHGNKSGLYSECSRGVQCILASLSWIWVAVHYHGEGGRCKLVAGIICCGKQPSCHPITSRSKSHLSSFVHVGNQSAAAPFESQDTIARIFPADKHFLALDRYSLLGFSLLHTFSFVFQGSYVFHRRSQYYLKSLSFFLQLIQNLWKMSFRIFLSAWMRRHETTSLTFAVSKSVWQHCMHTPNIYAHLINFSNGYVVVIFDKVTNDLNVIIIDIGLPMTFGTFVFLSIMANSILFFADYPI